jgi:hypothetical protein
MRAGCRSAAWSSSLDACATTPAIASRRRIVTAALPPCVLPNLVEGGVGHACEGDRVGTHPQPTAVIVAPVQTA